MPHATPEQRPTDIEAARRLHAACETIRRELARVVVGQHQVIEELLIALFSQGHCLIQGVPGLAKTLLANTLADLMDLPFQRIQFTPDLMPSDITGTDILQEDPQSGRRRFEFVNGPAITSLLLADEINRAPPKTQAALLQAMQERQVTVGQRTIDLPSPFFVIATQNPIEQEGTYPLPEAQLDRFMFMVQVQYPSREEELEIYKRTTAAEPARLKKVLSAHDIVALQQIVRRVPISETAYVFAVDLIRATRPNEPGASDFVRHWVAWGAGPRAGQHLITAAKARALIHGRFFVAIEDLLAVAPAVLRHRIVPTFNAQAEGVTLEQIIHKILLLIPHGQGERLL
ncbi:MAG: AAA family ATPase [Tepidisphaeraceae bacterium]